MRAGQVRLERLDSGEVPRSANGDRRGRRGQGGRYRGQEVGRGVQGVPTLWARERGTRAVRGSGVENSVDGNHKAVITWVLKDESSGRSG